MNAERLTKITEKFCDKYCQYPNVCADKEMEKVCDECPMNELFELIPPENSNRVRQD